jgi:hypothetical protein
MTTQEEEYLKFIGGHNPNLNKKIVEEHKQWLERKQRSTTSQGVKMNEDKLIRLPNGNWIDPQYIIEIRVLDEQEGAGHKIFPPRVVLSGAVGFHQVINRTTLQAAQDTADDIAIEINKRTKK